MAYFEQTNNLSVGKSISREMDRRGWNQDDLANVLGVSSKKVNYLIHDKDEVTVDIDIALCDAFGNEPCYWLKKQLEFNRKKKNNGSGIKARSQIYEHLPIADMAKKGWLKQTKDVNKLIELVENIFERKYEPDNFENLFMGKGQVAFRRSSAFAAYNPDYALTWFHQAKKLSNQLSSPEFNRKALKQLSANFNSFTMRKEGIAQFIYTLNGCGVKFLNLSHLKNTYIDGASFLSNDNPVIVYTARLNRMDNFWFVMGHEIGHILKHLNSDNPVFVNIEKGKTEWEQVEDEADAFALNLLKAEQIIDFFEGIRFKSHDHIKYASQILRVGEGVIVGILQKNGLISWRNFNEYKYQVLDEIPYDFKAERFFQS